MGHEFPHRGSRQLRPVRNLVVQLAQPACPGVQQVQSVFQDRIDGGLAVVVGLLLLFCGGAVLLALVNVQIFGLLSARDRQTVARDGWFPDPSGRHQLRFFDGTVWRADVWDSGVYSSDPEGVPSAPLSEGSGTTARPDGPAGGTVG